MRVRVMIIGSMLVLGAAAVSRAGEVNCKFVLKNLSLPGRTVQSVAETMSISEDDVKKCQEQQGDQGAGGDKGSATKPGSEQK